MCEDECKFVSKMIIPYHNKKKPTEIAVHKLSQHYIGFNLFYKALCTS